MATSGSYNWSVTRNDLIEQAFRKIGALGDHEAVTVDSNKLNVGIAAINPVLRSLAAKGMPLWAMVKLTVPFSHFTSVTPVTLGPSMTMATSYRVLKVVHAVRTDTQPTLDLDIPMTILPYTEYESLSVKGQTGTPLHVYHNPGNYTGTLNVWPLPDANQITYGEMHLWVHREYQDFDASTDEPDFPKEYTEAFIYALAYHLAPNYGVPPQDRDALRADRDALIKEIEGFGVEEGSFKIQPRMY